MLRRALLPVILLVFAVASAAVAVEVDEPAPLRPALGGPRLGSPLASARRLPGFVARPVGDRRLLAGLEALRVRLPGPSCLIVEEGGRRLFAYQPDVPLLGASTQKLLTASAALEELPTSERLRTRVTTAASRSGSVVEGDLWLVGGGDPLLATKDYVDSFERQPQLRTALERLAQGVVDAGVREVRGRILGDESRFDNARYIPTWRSIYIADNDSGPLSALTVNDGYAMFIPDEVEDNVPALDPPAHAAATLTRLLRERRVVVAGEAGSGVAPADTTELAAVDSHPIATIIGQMLRESDNVTAELMMKELGREVADEGSTEAGGRVVTDALAELGLPTNGVVVVDGSGLDRGNRVTCELLVAILGRADTDSALFRGLPVAGRTGTLWKRLKGTPGEGRLRAKTGSLFDVSSLAGFVETKGGNLVRFALVANGVTSVRESQGLQDELALLLARYPDLPALDDLGPEPPRR